jgi:hypothetical protein
VADLAVDRFVGCACRGAVFPSPIGWRFRFLTWEGADLAIHRVVAWNRCHHWWRSSFEVGFRTTAI